MTQLLQQAALLTTLLGVAAAAVVGLRLRRVPPTLAVFADYLLAAGLIRLAGQPSWTSLVIVATTAAVRMLLNAGLRTLTARDS